MVEFSTTRLKLEQLHKDSWVIRDKKDDSKLGGLFIHQQWLNLMLKSNARGLGVATEACYALMRILNHPQYKAKAENRATQLFLKTLGFKAVDNYFQLEAAALTYPKLYQKLNQQLGIDTQTLKNAKHPTSCQLIESDVDCFDRPTRLNPHAHQAWQVMKTAATNDGINLQLASAFRSMRYQTNLIQNKLDRGEALTQILKTNTAPGHSEHHTGCAMDITTDGFKPIEEEFDQSPAFQWLTANAAEFGFVMSYPKDNKLGIIYEPWHWCYKTQS